MAKSTSSARFPLSHYYWTRRLILLFPILLSLLTINCRMTEKTEKPPLPSQPDTTPADTSDIHRRAIAIDMHADTTQRLLDENVDLQQRLTDGHFDSVRAKEGGLDAQFFSIWVEPQLFGGGGRTAMKRADDQIAAVRKLTESYPDTWGFATSAGDVRRIVAEGKLA
ncbi:MAG TPA: membrane dipeptidase, partial [Pyrinomonadaceae bacterium]|nr:membrane dipeptidase [Pyrinomonadaceae bacterium]